MPHDRSRAESNDAPGLLNSPAKINIISGFAVFGIEAANIVKRPSIKRHVTARNMLRDRIGEQNVTGPPGRSRDAGLDPILRQRCNVRSAHSGVVAAYQSAN